MKRVLIACSRDWTGAARLPSMLGVSGLSVDVLARADSQIAASRWVSKRHAVTGRMPRILGKLLDLAPGYDRVIACDEPLLMALLRDGDERADGILPMPRETLAALLDKTRFPALAAASGVRVAESVVASSDDELAEALERIGLPAVLKGLHGSGGNAVRLVADHASANAAADEWGWPVLVERAIDGASCLMPCLFERGRLVAGLLLERLRTVGENAPSSVIRLRPHDPEFVESVARFGQALGVHGFVSVDFIAPADGSPPVVLEMNARPVPQLHLGRRFGVDMGAALRDGGLAGMDTPAIVTGSARVPLFPQELRRSRAGLGIVGGTVSWMLTPGAIRDVPWSDLPLVRRQLRPES